MKIEFKRNKTGQVSVQFRDMTQGEALALCHALRERVNLGSLVAEDLQAFLRNAIQGANNPEWRDKDQDLFEAIGVN